MTLEPLAVGLLACAALLTSILSAILGMAGGITLLAVMLLFLEPLAAVPVHGAIQLVSNGSRTAIQRRHVEWGLLGSYAVLLVPMSAVGLALARSLPPQTARVLIGVFVLVAVWAPHWLFIRTDPDRMTPRRRFFLLGGVIGLLNPTVGATGVLQAPFFLKLGISRQGVVGTQAACQTLGHLVKIALFGLAGFAFLEFAAPLLLLCASVVVGTWIGSRILGRVSEEVFVQLYRGVVTLVALRLVVWEGLAVVGLR